MKIKTGLIELLMFAGFIAAFPFIVHAAEMTGPSYKGVDLGPLIGLLLTLVTGVLGWLARKVAANNEAQTQQSNAKTAMIKLAALALAMVGDLWNELSREFQLRIADGKIDAADREAFRTIIAANIEQYTSADELEKITKALGLPLPGIIAKLAEMVIDRLTKAHDPGNTEVSAGAFPVDPPEPVGSLGG